MASTKNTKFTENLQDLSVHGWPRVFSTSPRSRRLLWLILCCVSCGFFISFAKQIIYVYGRRETYLTTKVTPVTSLKLPAITFCNRNLAQDETNMKGEVIFPVAQDLPSTCVNYSSVEFANIVNRQFFDNACKTFMAMSRNVTMKHDIFKLDLRFPNNFSFVPNHWPCFKLNMDGHVVQRREGEESALRMMLFFNESEKHDFSMMVPNYHMSEYRTGMYVDIHDPAEYIRSLTGISLVPGFHTLIELKKVISLRKRGPFSSNCYDDNDNMYVKVVPGKHTVAKCMIACETNFRYNKCGAVSGLGAPFIDRERYRRISNKSNEEIGRCVIGALNTFDSAACDCRVPCQQIEYKTQVTYRKWPQSWEVKELAQMLSDVTGISESEIDIELLRKYLIQVSIYYPDLLETKIIEEEAYGIEKVISDFGGQMGMFLGASFLSLIEIILVIYDYVKRAFRKRRSIERDGNGLGEDNGLPAK